jgi:hypothetical protein
MSNGYISMLAMSIERIFTRTKRRAAQLEHARVRVVAGKGIEGDRYFGREDEPGQNVTFIEAEEIEAFQRALGRPIDLSLSGRNIVTRGVRLNDLVGREFSVGAVRFRGVELVRALRRTGRRHWPPRSHSAQVVKRLVHRAGLRADALSTGEIALRRKARARHARNAIPIERAAFQPEPFSVATREHLTICFAHVAYQLRGAFQSSGDGDRQLRGSHAGRARAANRRRRRGGRVGAVAQHLARSHATPSLHPGDRRGRRPIRPRQARRTAECGSRARAASMRARWPSTRWRCCSR